MITDDRVSRKSKAIGDVRLSVHLFPLYLLNRLNFGLEFLVCMGHSSPEIEGQGHTSRSKVNGNGVWAC